MRNDRKKQEDYHETIFETWTGNFNGIHFMSAIWKDRCTGGKCSDCIERKHRAFLIQGQFIPIHCEDRPAGLRQDAPSSMAAAER